ncbi:MAG: c-type cytochrome [Geobacteraceae bacterium]|nr:c-type cytochrome [Geobacteraceae bacterium]
MAEKNDFDGIGYRIEKKSPGIFRLLFWGLVAWGVAFIAYYLFGGWSSEGEFEQKKKAKQETVAKGVAPAGVHKEGKKEDYIAMGKAEYAARCAVCHGPEAKGGIGPDLTRKEYKYGRSEQAITASISEGRPDGMPPFKNELSHEKIEGLVAYILSL